MSMLQECIFKTEGRESIVRVARRAFNMVNGFFTKKEPLDLDSFA